MGVHPPYTQTQANKQTQHNTTQGQAWSPCERFLHPSEGRTSKQKKYPAQISPPPPHETTPHHKCLTTRHWDCRSLRSLFKSFLRWFCTRKRTREQAALLISAHRLSACFIFAVHGLEFGTRHLQYEWSSQKEHTHRISKRASHLLLLCATRTCVRCSVIMRDTVICLVFLPLQLMFVCIHEEGETVQLQDRDQGRQRAWQKGKAENALAAPDHHSGSCTGSIIVLTLLRVSWQG